MYKKIDSLTSLRFIAAGMIVLHHTRESWSRLLPGLSNHVNLGQGVSFFFILSGFILTYVYPQFKSSNEVRRFFVARVARVWPAHMAAIILLFAIYVPLSFGEGRSILTWTLNIFMIQGWIPLKEVFFSFNAVAWSISTEFFFYLAFPFLIRDFETTWTYKLMFSFLLVIAIVWFCNYFNLPAYDADAKYSISRTALVYINPLSRLFEFVLGMCVALAWKKYYGLSNFGKITGSILELAALGVIALFLYLSSYAGYLTSLIGPAGSEYLGHTGASLSFALCIFIISLERGLVSYILRFKIPVLLGEISYSIYLFHQIILRFYGAHPGFARFLPLPVLYAVTLITTAFFVWMFIEKPSRRFIVKFGDGKICPLPR